MQKANLSCVAVISLLAVFTGCSPSDDSDTTQAQPPTIDTNSAPSVAFHLSWPVGNRYVQRLTLNEQNRLQLPGRPQPLVEEISLAQQYALTVDREDVSGGHELEVILLDTRIDVDVNGRSILNLDTTRDPAEGDAAALHEVFHGVQDMTVMVHLNVSNHTARMTGVNEIKSTVLARLPPQTRSVLSRVYTEDYFNQLALLVPLRALNQITARVGETWATAVGVDSEALGSAVWRLRFTFEKWDTLNARRCAVLRFEGTLDKVGDGKSKSMGLDSQIERGAMTGTTWFDPELGQARESRLELSIDLAMTMAIPQIGNKGGGTRTMHRQLRRQIHVKLLEWHHGNP